MWKTDGTSAGTVRVRDIRPGVTSSFAASLTVVGSTVYFTANDGTSGSELWKTDGTAAGTVRVRDIQTGSGGSRPTALTAVGSTLYFAADDGESGRELWKTNGTAAGTTMVANINPGSADAFAADTAFTFRSFAAVGNTLYFAANDGTSVRELWKTDGTADGTVVVKDIAEFTGSYPAYLTAVGSTLYFAANRDSMFRNEL